MTKKVLIGFVVVFVLTFALDYVVNNFILMPDYQATAQLWRAPEEMKISLIVICQLFFAFFFTLIFSKGYEGKGPVEGVRYGLYVALMVVVPAAYMSYATMPLPYSLSLKWFLTGTVQSMIYGLALALVFGKKSDPQK